VLGEEPVGDQVQGGLRGLDGPGMIGGEGGLAGVGVVVGAPVVVVLAGAEGLDQAAHPAAAVPTPDPSPVRISPGRGRVRGQAGPVPAGAVLSAGRGADSGPGRTHAARSDNSGLVVRGEQSGAG
jgi:hypothetical protein